MSRDDRELGMHSEITRRDFIHGVGTGLFAAWLPGEVAAGAAKVPADGLQRRPGYYPPRLTGMRGSHPGSFEVAHALAREGQRWPDALDAGESAYDLIVVGGGISGLATAWFYREMHGPSARILILDNHDDFGGHAKRNEFVHAGVTRLTWGGAVNLEYPGYGPVPLRLLAALGVDIPRLREHSQFGFGPVHGLTGATYFDADRYQRNTLVTDLDTFGDGPRELAEKVSRFPLTAAARKSLQRFLRGNAGLVNAESPTERLTYLRRTSYENYLLRDGRLTPDAAQFFNQRPHGLWAVGTDAVSAFDCFLMGMPGPEVAGPLPDDALDHGEDDFVMFPDGNASLARLLVRSLVPSVAPGNTMDDIVTAPFDYARLDEPDGPVRLRLNSTAVAVAHLNSLRSADGVEVCYVRGDDAWRVHARQCVLACNHSIIPYLCRELPEEQRTAIRYPQRAPLMISNVLLRDGQAFERLDVSAFYCPGRLHANAWLVGGLELGGYRAPWRPEEPAVLQLYGAIAAPGSGLGMKAQYRAGRARMLAMSFEDFEREIRVHLAGMLGGGGFDPARDIAAITVNRWPHGYAYEYSSLEDPEWPAGEAPHEIARRRFGQIAIANSDAAAYAYADGAIEQAQRAVQELAE